MEPLLNIDLNIPFNPCDHDDSINQLSGLNLSANVEDTSLSRDDSNIELHHEYHYKGSFKEWCMNESYYSFVFPRKLIVVLL
jgi:hypothetical protein